MQHVKLVLFGIILFCLTVRPAAAAPYDISASVSSSPELLQAEALLSTVTAGSDQITVGQRVGITITLRGIDKKPLPGRVVALDFVQGAKTTRVTGVSDVNGQFENVFTPSAAGTVQVRGWDTSSKPELLLSQEVTIQVSERTNNPLDAIIAFFAWLLGRE